MKTILTYGTFDLFHVGHLRLLKLLKKIANGGRVIVGVSTDEFNKIKGKKSIIPFDQRIEIIKSIDCVDIVIEEKYWDQKIEDIDYYKVDIFAIGEDWAGKFDDLAEVCEVRYIPRTKNISSSELKLLLKNILLSDPDNSTKAHEFIEQLSKGLS